MAKSNKRLEKLRQTYRLVLMNDETFEETASYRLTRLNIYLLLSTSFVVVAIFLWLLIIFTPMKRFIPGYGDYNLEYAAEKNKKEADELEKLVHQTDVLLASYIRKLTGTSDTLPSDVDLDYNPRDSVSIVPIVPEDSVLREEIARDELFNLIKSSNFNPKEVSLDNRVLFPPVQGMISASYDPDINHYGTDIVAPENTPIKSIADGMVFFSDWTRETGNTIAVIHSGNLVSFYKHNSVNLKKTGSYVKSGESLAIIGNTGELTDGPHLHFELWNEGRAVNAEGYINFKK